MYLRNDFRARAQEVTILSLDALERDFRFNSTLPDFIKKPSRLLARCVTIPKFTTNVLIFDTLYVHENTDVKKTVEIVKPQGRSRRHGSSVEDSGEFVIHRLSRSDRGTRLRPTVRWTGIFDQLNVAGIFEIPVWLLNIPQHHRSCSSVFYLPLTSPPWAVELEAAELEEEERQIGRQSYPDMRHKKPNITLEDDSKQTKCGCHREGYNEKINLYSGCLSSKGRLPGNQRSGNGETDVKEEGPSTDPISSDYPPLTAAMAYFHDAETSDFDDDTNGENG
ncbi:hypothetical protein P154DRAFT_577204 [Amniculicola lignicola CBS 123094]|uniref:Uncharacterized protein n=1 Tax=Amniculicola lignicola CBS 123094 TaxID=1392246 RepID=A0A6A5WJH9_9PLEO|nr:hypothetical protein P154DRAFT_577204 [Amniculicola lignicola CBS 123094]